MYRPLVIVVGFVIVTLGLIFFQPSRDRGSVEVAQAPDATQQPQAETGATNSPLAVAEAARPIARPADAVPSTGVEVTRAPLPVLQLSATPMTTASSALTAPENGEKAFADIAADRPNLLTATVRGANGQLALGASTPIEPNDEPVALVAPTPAPPPAPVEEPVVVEGLDELEDLRLQLAEAPTKAVHTVRLGDSLHTLALRYYGDAEKSNLILEANRRLIRDERVLTIGQILRIPEISNL